MRKGSERENSHTVTAAVYVPEGASLTRLADAIQQCRGCDLYRHAKQAVFGEGPASARIMLIGEQPGDLEDRTGKPFVGPAGKLLDQALRESGIDRSIVYVTNAVKHFKFEMSGKRRIHERRVRGRWPPVALGWRPR